MKLSLMVRFYLAMWLPSSLAVGGVLSAKSDGVALLSEARKGSTVVGELKKGDKIQSDERQGMFWKVRLKNGQQAYVSVISVQREAETESSLQGALRESALEARKAAGEEGTARSRSAVMGVRGLAENQEMASAGNLLPDTYAVYAMEDRTIDKQRLQGLANLVAREIEQTVLVREDAEASPAPTTQTVK